MNNLYWTSKCHEATFPRQHIENGHIDLVGDHELAAILLSSPKSSTKSERELAVKLASLKATELSCSTVKDLVQRFGLDERKAQTLIAAIEFGKRASSIQHMCLTSPEATMCYLSDMGTLPQEHFRSLCLDTKKHLLKMDTISIGDLSSSIAHPREIFHPAIKHLADSIIVAHNHPSGDPSPSDADLKLTGRLCRAGELLGIKIVDHIIVGAGCYVSLRREGLISE